MYAVADPPESGIKLTVNVNEIFAKRIVIKPGGSDRQRFPFSTCRKIRGNVAGR